MTHTSLKTKLTLLLPLAICILFALFATFLAQTDFSDIANHLPIAQDLLPSTRNQMSCFIAIICFSLFLFPILRHLLSKTTRPLFDFIHHLELLQSKSGNELLYHPTGPCEITGISDNFNELIVSLDSQRKEAKKWEHLYRTIEELSSDMVFRLSPDNKNILFVSPQCIKLTGYAPEEYYHDAGLLDRVIHPDFRQTWRRLASIPGHLGGQEPNQLALANRQGQMVWVNLILNPFYDEAGNYQGICGKFTDISHIRESSLARQASDEELRLQNDYLLALHETTLGLMGRLELHSLLSAIIARAAALMNTEHGFIYLLNETRDELEIKVKLGYFETIEHHPLKYGEGIAGHIWKQGVACATSDYRNWTSGNNDITSNELKATVGVPLTSNSDVIGVIGLSYAGDDKRFDDRKIRLMQQFAELASLALDNARLYDKAKRELNERTRAEEQLRKLSHAVMQSPLSIIITDLRGVIEFANPHVTRLTGYEPEELLGKTPSVLKSGLTSETKYKKMWDTILAGGEWCGEIQNRKKNGQFYWERMFISPLRDNNGTITHFMAIKEDIGDFKIMENQLRHAQKMEAIGQLAGGIAHDFNNILTAIIGYTNILMIKLPADHPLKATSEQILAAAERGANLTQGLLTFSRKQASNPLQINLNIIIEQIGKLLLSLLGESINLVLQLSSRPLWVMVDRMQMEQVLINLATNVRDAMPEGGSIVIKTERVEIDSELASTHCMGQKGPCALLTVSDTGHGMDEEMIKKIFDPFYTTKETGKGTGLGLSIVYGIIKKHNGHIVCDSKPDRGTDFCIYIPLHEEMKAPQVSDSATLPSQAAPNTILLADPDQMSRSFTRSLLEEFGYSVIEAVDSEAALKLLVEHQNTVRLVVLDEAISGPKAIKTFREIKANIPAYRIVLCSDPQNSTVRQLLSLESKLNFISKPFLPKELLMKVKEVVTDEI